MYLKIGIKLRSSLIKLRMDLYAELRSGVNSKSLSGSSFSDRICNTFSYLSFPSFCRTKIVARCPLAGETGFLGLKIVFPSNVKYRDCLLSLTLAVGASPLLEV
jgi:hypothetical protein